MEGWVGPVGWPIADSFPQSGHLSTIDWLQCREITPAKDRHPNHWYIPPTLGPVLRVLCCIVCARVAFRMKRSTNWLTYFAVILLLFWREKYTQNEDFISEECTRFLLLVAMWFVAVTWCSMLVNSWQDEEHHAEFPSRLRFVCRQEDDAVRQHRARQVSCWRNCCCGTSIYIPPRLTTYRWIFFRLALNTLPRHAYGLGFLCRPWIFKTGLN